MRQTYRSTKKILLVCICMLFAILACISGTSDPDTSVQEPTATTEAPPVVQASTNTPAPTESPWMEGSVERASYDPAAGWGAPDVHDDFSGTNPEFELDNSGGLAHGWYQDGRFNITFPSRGWWTWYTGNSSVVDFYVDVVVYNGSQCADRDAAGLLYRYLRAGDLGFLFGVTCGGGYFSGFSLWPGATGPVCIFLNSSPSTPADVDCSGIWEHPTSQYIDSGPGAANRIGVRGSGAQITLYINGHQVDNLFVTNSMVYSGNFALYLGAGQRDDASVSFDDLSIWFNP